MSRKVYNSRNSDVWRCSKCQKFKPWNEFHIGKSGKKKGIPHSYCRACLSLRSVNPGRISNSKRNDYWICRTCKERYPWGHYYLCGPERIPKGDCRTCREAFKEMILEDFIKFRLRKTKSNCKRNGREFTLSVEFMVDLYNSQNGLCYYTRLPMRRICAPRREDRYDAASIDRKDPSLGYIPTNVVWCRHQVNLVKDDLTEQEFLALCGRVTAVQRVIV